MAEGGMDPVSGGRQEVHIARASLTPAFNLDRFSAGSATTWGRKACTLPRGSSAHLPGLAGRFLGALPRMALFFLLALSGDRLHAPAVDKSC